MAFRLFKNCREYDVAMLIIKLAGRANTYDELSESEHFVLGEARQTVRFGRKRVDMMAIDRSTVETLLKMEADIELRVKDGTTSNEYLQGWVACRRNAQRFGVKEDVK